MSEITNCNTEFGTGCDVDPGGRPHACAYLGPHRVHECARCGAHAPNPRWVEPPDLAAEVAALRQQLDEARALAATCSCGSSPETYEGPEPDCPVHGAVRALNETQAALAKAVRERESLARRCAVRYEETEKLRDQLAVTRIELTAAQGAHDLAEADRDRLLVVYRAAEAWLTQRRSPDAFVRQPQAELIRLADAVDAYRSAAPAEPAPGDVGGVPVDTEETP